MPVNARKGGWYAEEELQVLLGELADSYRPSLVDRLWPLVLIATSILNTRKPKFMPQR
jgi:hypothetical protein